MKNSYFLLLLCAGFAVPSVRPQQLPDAQTWEHLTKASSSSIKSVADNCQKTINEAKNSCKINIDRAVQSVSQEADAISAQSTTQKTVDEVSALLTTASGDICRQLLELGNRFEKRLDQVLTSSDSTQSAVIQEVKTILQSPIDENDQIIITSRQFFSAYNPAMKFKTTINNEIQNLAAASLTEFNQLEKTVIEILNRYNKAIIIAKELQASLKKSGKFPQQWKSQEIKTILSSCAQITSTLQTLGKTTQAVQNSAPTRRQTIDDDISLEETEIEEEDGTYTHIFERTKKKMMNVLVSTVKDIKKATDIKTIDAYTYNTLEDYSFLLNDVSQTIDSKIVDFTHQFVKLYKIVMDILAETNEGMKDQLFEIFNSQATDTTDFYYNNIQKYFTQTFFTEAQTNQLHTSIATSIKAIKARKEIQKQIIKQLSLVTSDLVRDVDNMKSTTTYILVEMQKGVTALQNIRSKSDISGIRYFFNFYDGKADLAQLDKLIHIINTLDMSQLFAREFPTLLAPDHVSKCEFITQATQETLLTETTTTLNELQTSTTLREVDSLRSKYLQDFNSIITTYTLRVKKIVKRVIVKFIKIYEETLIILKRKHVKSVQLLDQMLDDETRNIDSEMPVFAVYLADNAQVDIERDSGIKLRRKFKDIKDAQTTIKTSIGQINQTLTTQVNKINSEIREIMNVIVEEAKNLQLLQAEIEENQNFEITLDKFAKLEYLMRLANTLKVSHGDITNVINSDVYASNQQLQSYFVNAVERLRNEKQDAELEIETCTDTRQLQAQVTMVASHIREIISDTVMEMRTDINQYTYHYKSTLLNYVKCTKDEKLVKTLKKSTSATEITFSEHLQAYIQDKYTDQALQVFLDSIKESEDFQKTKETVLEILTSTIKQIETDMESAKFESMSKVFDNLKTSIDLLEDINKSETKLQLEETQTKILISSNTLLKVLQDVMVVDSVNDARSAISTARSTLETEYENSVHILSSITDTMSVQTETQTTVDIFESVYNTMRQRVKSKMERLSSEFYENFRAVNAQSTQTSIVIQEIMSGVYNNQFNHVSEYQTFLSVVNSESYTSSLAVNSMYEQIQHNQTSMANGRSLNVLNDLNLEVIKNINQIEEQVEFISRTYEESTSVVTSITKGKLKEINENEISLLTKSLLLHQSLMQVQNRADFASVQKTINKEYRQAVRAMSNTNEETQVTETMLKSIEKYDTVSNLLQNEVVQKFMKTTSDFTSMYEMIITKVSTQNEELSAILQNIVEKKTCDVVSEKYKTFESYINSSGFKSTTFAKDSYERMLEQQTNSSTCTIKQMSVDQLKSLTFEVNQYIRQLDIESRFANENFLKGSRILQSIQGGNFRLTKEHIQGLTECVMISQIINKHSFSTSNSNEESLEIFVNAEKLVDEEYNAARETINSTREEDIIEQAVSASAYKYDNIYIDVREQMKRTFSTLQSDFTTTYDTVMLILQSQNVPVYEKLKKVRDTTTFNTTSAKYMKFESYIKSDSFTSYSLTRNAFLKIKQDSQPKKNIKEANLERLTLLTRTVRQQIQETSFIQKYVIETLTKSVEILQSTETDLNVQLNEEQLSKLREGLKVSKIISSVISFEEQMQEKFTTAERNINDVYEDIIYNLENIDRETSQKMMYTTIQTYTNIYNELRKEVKEIFTHSSSYFLSTFTTVSQSLSLHNTNLSSTFDDIKTRKINVKTTTEYEKFTSYITSDTFASSSYVTHAYQDLNVQELSNIERLKMLTTEVKQSIIEMNSIRRFVFSHFIENITNLRGVESGAISQLSLQQITTLLESVNMTEIITFTCTMVSSEREQVFENAETAINAQYEKSINEIQEAKQDLEIVSIMDSSVQSYENTYNSLREQVKQTLTETSSEFTNVYANSIETLKSENNTQLFVQLQNIRNSKNTLFIDGYKKCELYLNSVNFKSISWVSQYYETLQNCTSTTKKTSMQQLKTVTTEVNYQITQASYTSKYITQIFEKSTEIFKLVETDVNMQQLSQDQINLITESTIIRDLISLKFSSKSEQEVELFITAQTNIMNEYQNSVNAIRAAVDEKKVKETLLNSVRSYDTYYNSFKNEVKQTFIETTTEFSETLQTVVTQVTNSKLQTLLREIQTKKIDIQVSQEYTKFESYISSEKFTSSNTIKRSYKTLQKQSSSQELYQLKFLTSQVNTEVIELNEIRQYVSETIQKSNQILKTIETNINIELTQEQITILTESSQITEIVSVRCSSISQEEEELFNGALTNIDKEYDNAITTITSAEDEETIRETVKTTVRNYDTTYTETREEIKKTITTITIQFTETYTNVIETFISQKNTKIQTLLQAIQRKKINVEVSEQYKKFESYLNSESFTSNLLATRSHQYIQQQSSSLTKQNVAHQLETVTETIETQLTEMNSMRKYVSETLQKSTKVLKKLEQNVSVQELTQQEITILTESIFITETVSIEFSSKSATQEEHFAQAELQIQQEQEQAINEIRSTSDEKTIKETLEKSVLNYNTIYNSIKEETQNTFTESSFEFTKAIEENTKVKNIIQEIQNHKVELQVSQEYTIFKTFITSEIFSSTSTVTKSYEKFQSETTSNVSHSKRSVNELQQLTSQVNECLMQTNIVRKYVNRIFQKSTKILKIIEEEDVELTIEQKNVLNESMLVSQTLSSNQSVEIVSQAETKINQEYQNSLQTLKSTTNEEEAQQALAVTIDRYDTVYDDACNNVQSDLQNSQASFINKIKSTMESIKTTNSSKGETLEKIIRGKTTETLQQDQDYQKFVSYASSDFKSSKSIQKLYQSNKMSTSTTQTLTTLTDEVHKKLKELDYIEKYASQNYEKSLEILEKASKGVQDFTKEEISILTITSEVTRLLSQQITIQEINTLEAQNTITKETENSIRSIETLETEEEVNKVVNKNLQTYSQVYEKMQETVKTELIHTSTEFTQNLQNIDSNILTKMENKKQEIQNNQELQEFTKYIQNMDTKETIKTAYENIHTETAHTENVKERAIKELTELSTEVNQKITEIEKYQKYATDNISKGQEVLKGVQAGEVELDEEQIITLTKTIQIIEVVTKTISTTYTERSIGEYNEYQSSLSEETIDVQKVEKEITQECDKTISAIKTAENEESIQKAVHESVEHYNTVHNEVKEEVQTQLTQSSLTFENTFNSTFEAVSNTEVKKVLQEIVNNEASYETDEKIQKFQSYITSENFKSNSTVKNLYKNLHENATDQNVDIKQRSIEEEKTLSSTVSQEIHDMEEIRQYVNQNLQQGEEILKSIQNENIELSETHKEILTRTYTITRIITENTITSTEEQSGSADTETHEIDITKIQNVIVEERSVTIEEIKSTENEEKVQEIVEEQIETFDKTYTEVFHITQTQIIENTTNFTSTLQTTMNKAENTEISDTLNQIVNENSNYSEDEDEELQNFFTSIKTETFSSNFSVTNIYKSIHESEINSTTDLKEKSIHEVETVSTKMNENLNTMHETTKFVSENLQKSAEILKKVENKKEVKLSEEEEHQIARSVKIIKALEATGTILEDVKEDQTLSSSPTTEVQNTEEKALKINQQANNDQTMEATDFTSVQNVIKEENSATIDLIKSTQDEEKVKEIAKERIQTVDKTYREVRQTTETHITHSSSNFTNIFQSTVNNLQNTEVGKILSEVMENTTKYSEDNEEVQNFVKTISSSPSSLEVESSEESDETDVKEKSIRKIETVSTKMSEKLNTIHETEKFVSENLQKGADILKKVETHKETKLSEEDVKQIVKSMLITKQLNQTLDTSVSSNNKPVLVAADKQQLNISAEQSSTVTNKQEKKAIMPATNLSTPIIPVPVVEKKEQLSTVAEKQEMKDAFETNSKGQAVPETPVEKRETITENQEIKQTLEVAPSSQAVPILQEKTSVEKKNEQSTAVIDTLPSIPIVPQEDKKETSVVIEKQITEKKLNSTLSEHVPELKTLTPKLELENEEQSLKQEMNSYMSSSSPTTKQEYESYQSSATVENDSSTSSEIQEKSITHTSDLTQVQNTLKEETKATINSIQSAKDDDVKEIVKEHLNTFDETYNGACQTTQAEISQNSSNFINTLQSTVGETKNDEVRNTLNDIMIENTKYSPEKDDDLQKFVTQIKSDTFSAASLMTNIDQIKNKETGIKEIKAISEKVNENLHTMDETNKFVSENLQKSEDILKKVESEKELQLSEDEVNQIARSMQITKELHDTNIVNSNTSYSGRSLSTEAPLVEEKTTDTIHSGTSYSGRSLNTAVTSVEEKSTDTIHSNTSYNSGLLNASSATPVEEKTTSNNSLQKSSTVVTEQKSITTIKDLVTDDQCLSVEQPQVCVKDESKIIEEISIDKLLVNWDVTESAGNWPSKCRGLFWSDEKFVQTADNKVFLDEIGQILGLSRNLIENTIQMELKKLKINLRKEDILSSTTVCVGNIHNILQRLSTFVFEEMERFSRGFNCKTKIQQFETKLKSATVTLDEEFVSVSKAFFQLQFSKNNDMLEIVDHEYKNEICDTVHKSKEVAKKKLQKLQLIVSTILNNIDCLVLTMLDTFVDAKVIIANSNEENEACLTCLKNTQILTSEIFDV